MSVVFPYPSWPLLFDPQHRTDPSIRRAQACVLPAAISTASRTPPSTARGVSRSVVVPSPSWRLVLIPQQFTVPPPRSTQVYALPAATPSTGSQTCVPVRRQAPAPTVQDTDDATQVPPQIGCPVGHAATQAPATHWWVSGQ